MSMTKIIAASIVAAFIAGCGPSIDEEPERIGHLEYQYGPGRGIGSESGEWYRSGRRIEFFPEKNPYYMHVCAMLTQEAHDQLERTIAALDPSADYELASGECGWSDAPSALVHLEGFADSPFSCDWLCCRDELGRIPSTYFLAANELSDEPIDVHGQPYPVIDVDSTCD